MEKKPKSEGVWREGLGITIPSQADWALRRIRAPWEIYRELIKNDPKSQELLEIHAVDIDACIRDMTEAQRQAVHDSIVGILQTAVKEVLVNGVSRSEESD
ncbi:hypothetical protein pEaSNUABM8_00035 [Erwinia phage pEa_SNUABM_8]|nr:hypothetical protein pEaSNUABM8_00035 [Erwinia phage pEa_SNUABM_8]QVW54787.1 hypothetical protein pEaSNUABM4_00034 [Erwinia phage pEa_SNUABM_4]